AHVKPQLCHFPSLYSWGSAPARLRLASPEIHEKQEDRRGLVSCPPTPHDRDTEQRGRDGRKTGRPGVARSGLLRFMQHLMAVRPAPSFHEKAPLWGFAQFSVAFMGCLSR